MTCRSLPPVSPAIEDAIVEVARGRDVGRGTLAAVESHIETCATCAARLARERRVSERLRALAAATASAAPSAAIESRLMAACAARQPARRRQTWVALVAAAAAIVLAMLSWRSSTGTPAQPPPVPVSRSAPEPAAPPPIDVQPPVRAVADDRPRGGRGPARRAAVNDSTFIALPAAAGLPDFESGVIVRMELPPAALPAYGLEIVTGSKMPVEADLLIGQDGQARAIRLVNRSITRSGAEQ